MEYFGVIAYHLILTHYGFWLPNDPRGSWSDFVRAWDLLLAGGPATKTDMRRSVASKSHSFADRLKAKMALVRTPVVLSGLQAQAVGIGFGKFCARSQCKILECSIMPRHSHLVVERPPYLIEQAANLLKGAATTELINRNLHPFADQPYENGKLPSPWARKQWACYLNNDADIRRAISYVERNPLKDGLPPQHWPFVQPWLG
jgi:REP element-mobilizing transposase RayT